MKALRTLYTLLFGVAVLLFFGLAYPHHLHYQEQFQLFLFDGNYVWDVVKLPGGVADLLGRFCTQFFLYAWVGALIIALLLSAVQMLTLCLFGNHRGWLYGLSFLPSFLLWLFLLDENALLSGVWAVLLTLLAAFIIIEYKGTKTQSGSTKCKNTKSRKWKKIFVSLCLCVPFIILLYWVVGPVCFPIPIDSLWLGVHYHRYPTVFPWLLWAAAFSAIVLILAIRFFNRKANTSKRMVLTFCSFAVVSVVMGTLIWKNANIKAEKVMQYDFMACHQQWNRILETVNAEKPNNQIGVTVQNLALAMRGMLLEHMFDYHQNSIHGLLPDVKEDATSPMPTAEAFYQLGMINVAQRTVFEAQEAILDFQKSGRCYKRLAQTNLINGQYEVARKYLMALQKTLFYREWANETLPLLGNEKAIDSHPEYGRLRQCAYNEDFYFSDHVTPEMLESLYYRNTDNRLAYQYLLAYCMLTGDKERYNRIISKKQ